jgi:hypothetical protein
MKYKLKITQRQRNLFALLLTMVLILQGLILYLYLLSYRSL